MPTPFASPPQRFPYLCTRAQICPRILQLTAMPSRGRPLYLYTLIRVHMYIEHRNNPVDCVCICILKMDASRGWIADNSDASVGAVVVVRRQAPPPPPGMSRFQPRSLLFLLWGWGGGGVVVKVILTRVHADASISWPESVISLGLKMSQVTLCYLTLSPCNKTTLAFYGPKQKLLFHFLYKFDLCLTRPFTSCS